MPEGTAAAASASRSPVAAAFAALRFVATDRIGLVLLVWLLIAFVVRPLLMMAHQGQPIPLLAGLASDPAGLSRLLGMVQVLSMILPVAAAAMVHLRLPAHAEPTSRAFVIPAVYAALFTAGYLAFVWTPTTYLSLITSDSFIFFDANYRISNGERPHVDFPTALGAVTLYLPWLGAQLAGGNAGGIELISALIALPLGIVCAHAGMRRFPTGATAAIVALVFMVAVPAVLLGLWFNDSHTIIDGQPVVLADNASYAMFYNRWGWAVLLALFCYLAPRHAPARERDSHRQRAQLIETLVLAALLAFLFYLKITYFLVGCGAAAIYAFTNEKPVRTLAIGAGAALGAILAVGLSTGLLIPYLRDLAFVATINAAKSDTLLVILKGNIAPILLALSPLGILAILGRFTWKDALIGGFLAVASIFLVAQNAQLLDVITLASLAAYGLARIWPEDNRLARFAAAGVFAMVISAPLLDRTFGLIQQTSGARREETRPPAAWAGIPALKNVHMAERENLFEKVSAATTQNERLDAWHFSNRMKRKEVQRQGEYMASVMAGMEDLKPVLRPNDSIVTLEMANPFPFLLNARSAKGSYLTLDDGRTLSPTVYPDAASMFADADHVMIPRTSSRSTAETAMHLYAGWLTAHYESRVETLWWTRWSRRKAPGTAPTQAIAIR
jgi:hypothetical protein